MNTKDLSELKRRFRPESNNITCIRGCYVNGKREIISTFNQSLITLPQEEAEKYLALFRRTLTGVPGKNLLDIGFTPGQMLDGREHKLLMALKDSALSDDAAVQALYEKIIESLEMDGNYLILLMHDAYDVPYIAKDEQKVDDASETVYSYVLCSVCPVKLTKPALRYDAQENEFHARDLEWVVASPELGFLFPAFEDRCANVAQALYCLRDAGGDYGALTEALFGATPPMPADRQKEAFQSALTEALGETLKLDVVQAMHEELCMRIEEQKTDKEAPAPTVSPREMRMVLETCGVPEPRVAAFEEKYEEAFGKGADVSAVNIVDTKAFAVRAPGVLIKVDPEKRDLVETRVIDGCKYILIRVDEDVQVDGVNINI